VWLIAAPPLLDFQASQHLFRPYWVPLGLAVVIMLAEMLRALAPLDVPGLRTVSTGLAVMLVVAAFAMRANVSSAVWINQAVVGAAVALVSLVVAVGRRRRRG
jgi:ABC-type cobalamin transport system permease subunit